MPAIPQPHPDAIALLRELSLGTHPAACLAVLGSVEEATSKDLEAATGLRQPHVSAALRSLEEKGWIRSRIEKRAGPGRPRHVYRLAKDLAAIVDEVHRSEAAKYEHVTRVAHRLTRFRVWEKARS
ncbi:MAG TPA: MarR family transcriptional regulator [Candidatus Thermoplasmatota archaeon]|nr:MarR family transcriptional regulator [Candidatus Thermoplasmatota archaeon]